MFTVILGNPPYCVAPTGVTHGYRKIYPHYIDQCNRFKPKFSTLLVPCHYYLGKISTLDRDWCNQERANPSYQKITLFQKDVVRAFEDIKLDVMAFYKVAGNSSPCEVKLYNPSPIDKLMTKEELRNYLLEKIETVHGKGYANLKGLVSRGCIPRTYFKQGFNLQDLNKTWSLSLVPQQDSLPMYLSKRAAVTLGIYEEDKFPVVYVPSSLLNSEEGAKLINQPKLIFPVVLSSPYLQAIVDTDNHYFSRSFRMMTLPKYQKQKLTAIHNLQKYTQTDFFNILLYANQHNYNLSPSDFELIPLLDFISNEQIDWNLSVETLDKVLFARYDIDDETAKTFKNCLRASQVLKDKHKKPREQPSSTELKKGTVISCGFPLGKPNPTIKA